MQLMHNKSKIARKLQHNRSPLHSALSTVVKIWLS